MLPFGRDEGKKPDEHQKTSWLGEPRAIATCSFSRWDVGFTENEAAREAMAGYMDLVLSGSRRIYRIAYEG